MVKIHITGVLEENLQSMFATFKDFEKWYSIRMGTVAIATDIIDSLTEQQVARTSEGYVNNVPVACSFIMKADPTDGQDHRVTITDNCLARSEGRYTKTAQRIGGAVTRLKLQPWVEK